MAKVKMQCSPYCSFFPDMTCNNWVYDENDPNIGLSGYKDGEKEVTLTKNDLPKTIGQALLYDSNAAEQSSETDALVTQWSKKYRTGLENVVNQFGGGAHNNMPPYETFYFWKRTA